MRWPDGYAAHDPAWMTALTRPLDRRVRVQLQTVNYVHVADLALDADSDSQLDADLEAEGAHRKARLTVFDDEGLLLGPSMHLQMQVSEVLTAEGLPRPAVTPLFCGPIVRPPSRSGRLVTLECEDRAAIPGRGRIPKTYPVGNTVALIEQILRDSGETRFRFPKSTDRTDEKTSVGRDAETLPLLVARKLAAALDLDLYPDAEGWWALRDYPSAAIDLTGLMVAAGEATAPSEIVNHVVVKGKGAANTTSRTLADLDPNHPLTPRNLRVGAVDQFFTTTEEDTKLNTKAKVNARADRLIRDARSKLDETRRYTLIPFPGLDLRDRVQLGADVVTVRSFTYSLNGGDMTLGWTAPLSGVRR